MVVDKKMEVTHYLANYISIFSFDNINNTYEYSLILFSTFM